MKKIAINGFGRIGRLFFRNVFENEAFEIAAINDLGNVENLAYLLKYDTVYGKYGRKIKSQSADQLADSKSTLEVDGKEISFFQEKDPAKLPWGELGIDLVVEATGAFESFEKAKVHLDAGAGRVVITAPAKDGAPEPVRCSLKNGSDVFGKTILSGINEKELKTHLISSNGSCTTNAASPVIQILLESIGIEKAILNTVHGYTATQLIVDGPVKGGDFRRGRAGAQNIIPSTTGAAIAVTKAIPELSGDFDGIAMRVPVPSGSVADITFISKKETSVEEVNNLFRNAAKEKRWEGVLSVSEDQIVSSDIIGEPYGAIVDLTFTKVVGGNLVKVLSWYDNEAGYVATLTRHVKASLLI